MSTVAKVSLKVVVVVGVVRGPEESIFCNCLIRLDMQFGKEDCNKTWDGDRFHSSLLICTWDAPNQNMTMLFQFHGYTFRAALKSLQ